jgi:hypothetical protein
MQKNYKIYSLASSENPDIIRYIGYTGKQTIEERLKEHIREINYAKNNKKINWLKKIINSNFDIVITLIENNILSKESAEKKELEYILLFKSI